MPRRWKIPEAGLVGGALAQLPVFVGPPLLSHRPCCFGVEPKSKLLLAVFLLGMLF